MKLINKTFIILFGLALASAILAFCLDQTILKADYVAAQADKSGIYTDLAKQLPKQLVGSGQTSASDQAALEQVITPVFLQTHLDSYFHDLEAAYRSGGAVPPLDLTAIISQAEAMGVQFTPAQKADLTKQLTIQAGSLGQNGDPRTASQSTTTSPPSGASTIYRRTAQTKWLLALAGLVLAGLVFVSAPHHRLKALGHGMFGATFWLAIYYAIFRLVPGIASHQLKTAKDFSLSGSVTQLISLTAKGVSDRILVAAIVTAALGVLLWLVSHLVPHFGGGHDAKHGGSDRTPLPSVFHKD